MKRISKSYVGTFYTGSAGDMLEIETIRKSIRAINATAKAKYKNRKQYLEWIGSDEEPGSPDLYYVKCQGRGPRTKHARADGRYPRAYDQSLPLRHAERLDVYVYER
tara:strand:- start:372 stop:692 length:321 start_codon:yes stop_codon:yes gene_type:complete